MEHPETVTLIYQGSPVIVNVSDAERYLKLGAQREEDYLKAKEAKEAKAEKQAKTEPKKADK